MISYDQTSTHLYFTLNLSSAKVWKVLYLIGKDKFNLLFVKYLHCFSFIRLAKRQESRVITMKISPSGRRASGKN